MTRAMGDFRTALAAHGLVIAEDSPLWGVLLSEFESRVGHCLAETLSEGEVNEFTEFAESADGDSRAPEWLLAHVPDYRRVVGEVERALIEDAVAISPTVDLAGLRSWPAMKTRALGSIGSVLWLRGFRPDGVDLARFGQEIAERATSMLTSERESALAASDRDELRDLRAAIAAGELPESAQREWWDRYLATTSGAQRYWQILRGLINDVLDVLLE